MRASFSDRFYIAAPQGVAVKLSDMLSSAQIIPSGVVHTGDEAVRAAKDGALLLTTYRLPDMTGEENLEAMMDAVSMVKTGQVTYAVRDTRLDEKEIHEGDIMGIGDRGILAVGKGKENVAKEMVAAMVDEDSEVISIYYGAETTEEDAQALGEELEALYPDCEIEVNSGGQPIYYYIISVE